MAVPTWLADRRTAALGVALGLLSPVFVVGLPRAQSRECEPGERCVPTPQDCAAGAPVYTDGGEPGRAALCVASDGRTLAYVGGDALTPCGTVVVADQPLVESGADPNDCPGGTNQLPGSRWHEEWFPSADGTLLHASVFRPDGVATDATTPVLLIVTPYSNSGGTGEVSGTAVDLTPTGPAVPLYQGILLGGIVPEIFERGYTLVIVSARGIGGSEGCDDFGGPDAQTDVHASVEWAASRPWSTGKVGMWGLSAEGWTQVMALATDPTGLAAVVIQEPPIDRYAQSYMHGVPYWATPFGSALRYGHIAQAPPSVRSSPEYLGHWANGGGRSSAGCSEANVIGSASHDPADPFWTARDLTARAADSDVPVFLAQGFLDSNVKPGVFLDLWSNLTGPKRAWFAQAEHTPFDGPDNPWIGPGRVGRDTFKEEAIRWLDTFVRGIPAHETGVDGDPAVTVERADGSWRAEAVWPPLDRATETYGLLAGGYHDVSGNAAEAPDPISRCPGSVGGASGCARVASGLGSWTFTPPFDRARHLAGAAALSVEVATVVPGATLIALIYDVEPSGRATLLTRGAARIGPAGESTVALSLYPQDWLIEAGHRIGILLTGSDTGWFAPVHTGTAVGIRSGSVSLPLLESVHDGDLTGTLSLAGRQRRPIAVDASTISARTAP